MALAKPSALSYRRYCWHWSFAPFFSAFQHTVGVHAPHASGRRLPFVSKYAYGYSRYSLPFGPNLFSGRIWSAEPKRGDVVVFKLPSDPSVDYIKRVIGLPGDRIQMRGGVLYINEQPVKRERVGTIDNPDVTEVNRPVEVYRETLPDGVTYDTLDLSPNSIGDDTRVFEVPAGHYFMMGDNRDNSLDSRFGVGYVPFENLVGRANIIFFSIADKASPLEIWKWPTDVRFGRLFSSVGGARTRP